MLLHSLKLSLVILHNAYHCKYLCNDYDHLKFFYQGYNQYNFPEALWQIEKSTQILENLLNSKHVFIAASWRLKALLLEGLAANTENEQVS